MGTEQTKHCHWSCTIRCLMFVLLFHTASAQFAKSSYFMDSSTDCYNAGYLLIKNDGVVNINGRRPEGPSSDVLTCTLRFRPEDTRNIIDLRFTYFTMSDPDVSLRVDLQGGGTYTLTAGSSKPNQMTSVGGMVTIFLKRLYLDDRDYSFGIIIRVYKEDDGQPEVDDGRGPVGLVVGLIVGIIAFLVFIAVIGVCCYRRRKEQYLAHQHGRNYKGDLADEAITPSHSYGIDNAAQKEMYPPCQDPEVGEDYERYSPHLKQKLLTPLVNNFDGRDRSGSESDSKDPYIMRNYDRSPTKTSLKYEDENFQNSVQENKRPREYSHREGNIYQKQTQLSGSPNLSTQHSNPRFRPERDITKAASEMRRDSDFDSESDVSTKGRFEKVNTSVGQEPQPEKTPSKPLSVPPLSNSPKSSTRQDNTSGRTQSLPQNASRSTQPYLSSSSSETEQITEGKGGDRAYTEEKIPFSVSQEKPDTRHTLRPDRTKKKQTPEKPKPSPEYNTKEQLNPSDSKPPKSTKEKSRPKKTDKSDKKGGSKQDTPEYEGRFKKADSARKSKSKTPRMGRSRSTGNALDDADSISRGSVSSAGGYRAVPSVTADDYEDSDTESNYNPLRRTTSKSSLYASRSSLYGRRRRKNSIGESVYSFAYDDPDYFDRGSVKNHSLSRRHRGFRSLGDLEMELRNQATRSTQTLRETATQTKARKNSVSSTSGRSRSRDRKNSVSSTTGRPKRAKSESELRRKAREAEEDREPRAPATPKDKPNTKPKPRPKPKPRKSTTTMEGDDRDTKETGDTEASELSRGGVPVNPVVPVYPPHGYPGYMVGYPPQMPYMQAGGQAPVMVPYGPVPVHPGAAVVNPGAVVPNSGAVAPSPDVPGVPGPPTAPKPSTAKWEMLCRMTDAAKERDGESVAGSVFSSS